MAQVDYYLKINGVDGESTDHKHKGEIELQSWSWGETNAGTAGHGSGHGAGKVVMQDIHFTMLTNKASTKLFLGCATGEHFKDAILTCRKAGKDPLEFLVIKLTDVLVSSYQVGGSHGGVVPSDQVSLNFGKIEVEYKAQKPDGTAEAAVKAGYNQTTNKMV